MSKKEMKRVVDKIKSTFWEGYLPEPVKPAEKEPIGYWNGFFDAGDVATISKFKRVHNSQNAPLYTSPPAQQEPVAVTYKEVWDAMNALYAGDLKQIQIAIEMGGKELYTSPPAQRTWVGLTDNEIALTHADYPHPQGFARAIEAKLKEKNNG